MRRFTRVLPGLVVIAALVLLTTGCSRVGRAERQLSADDPVLRAAAAESLGAWGATDLAAEIHPLMRDQYAGVRELAAEALARLGDSTSFRGMLQLVLADSDAGVRTIAAQALADLMPDTSAGELARLLDNARTTEKLRAAHALTGLVRVAGDRLGTPTRTQVGRALSGVVQAGQAAREQLPGNWQAWEDYRRGAIAPEDTGEVLTDQAALGLAWLGGESGGGGLLRALRGTVAPALRDSLLSVLVATGDTLVTERLIADCRTGIVSARKRAVDLLGGLPNALAREALLEATDDPTVEVRRQAWQSLLRLHGLRLPTPEVRIPTRHFAAPSPELLARAKTGLREPDPRIWRSAALLLLRNGEKDAVRALIERGWTEPAWLGTTLEILADAPESIAAPAPAGLRALVERGASSPDPVDRAGAARALGRWEVASSAGLLTRLVGDARAEVVVAALEAVARRQQTALLADVLLLFGADSVIQEQAARTAAALVDVHSSNYLILALTTDQLHRRRAAVAAVRYVGERVHGTAQASGYDAFLSHAGSWLARMAKEELEPRDRANALAALGYTHTEGAEEALGLGLGDSDEQVQLTAAVAAARIRPELSVPSLRKLALTGSEEHKREAVEALGGLDLPGAREALRTVSVLESSPEIRRLARASLSQMGRPPA